MIKNTYKVMNNSLVNFFDKWLPILLLLVLKQGEVLR
jgi:hypothetical protein